MCFFEYRSLKYPIYKISHTFILSNLQQLHIRIFHTNDLKILVSTYSRIPRNTLCQHSPCQYDSMLTLPMPTLPRTPTELRTTPPIPTRQHGQNTQPSELTPDHHRSDSGQHAQNTTERNHTRPSPIELRITHLCRPTRARTDT